KYNVSTYKDYGASGSTNGVTAANFFKSGNGKLTEQYDYVYNYYVSYTNFAAELNGYFLATQSGQYTFSFYGDDSTSLTIGSAGSCCGIFTDIVNGSAAVISAGKSASFSVQLQKGLYYPMQLLYLNFRGDASISVSYTQPDGTTVSELGGSVYQISSPENCYTTRTEYWTGSESSTTTQTGSVTKTVVVRIPYTTATNYWTNDYTSTTTTTPSDGGKPTVIVEYPPVISSSFGTASSTTTTTVTPTDEGQPALVVRAPSSEGGGCLASSILSTGAYVNFYKYPYSSPVYKTQPDFYFAGYKQFGYLSSVPSVTAINFNVWLNHKGEDYSTIYGYGLSYTNFAMDVSGWFRADQTGLYTFTLMADDGGSIQFGSVSGCCGKASSLVSGSKLDASYPSASTASFSLVKGVYYPIKIVYVNQLERARFEVSYRDPSGNLVTELGTQLYQIEQSEECAVTTTHYGTGSHLSTSTVTPPDGDRPTVIVEVPIASTSTSTWTGSYTTMTTVTGTDGIQTPVVEVPGVKTSTSTWTGSYTTLTTVTGTDGVATPVVEVPGVKTSTSTWTGSYTTLTTVTGTDGVETPVVEVPGVKTSTSTWTGSYTTLTTVTGTDGVETPVVEVPGVKTSTSTWTGSYTTLTTVTGTDAASRPSLLRFSV
ncbi:hypothetical protein OXX59_009198, partial [Metschnikowia pulcherrima]